MQTTFGKIAIRRPIFVPMGRMGDVALELGELAGRCTYASNGSGFAADYRVTMFASDAAASQAVKMGAQPMTQWIARPTHQQDDFYGNSSIVR